MRDGQEVRLTQAALETLAVVAYRQPVGRAQVSAVRGVNCDGVMRTLSLRGLVEEAGNDQETGAILFRTTSYFLERLGLASLDQLPELAPFLPDQLDDETEAGQGRAGSSKHSKPGGQPGAGRARPKPAKPAKPARPVNPVRPTRPTRPAAQPTQSTRPSISMTTMTTGAMSEASATP